MGMEPVVGRGSGNTSDPGSGPSAAGHACVIIRKEAKELVVVSKWLFVGAALILARPSGAQGAGEPSMDGAC
jgi:hypothetical protein